MHAKFRKFPQRDLTVSSWFYPILIGRQTPYSPVKTAGDRFKFARRTTRLANHFAIMNPDFCTSPQSQFNVS
jgi:hypothetical protein